MGAVPALKPKRKKIPEARRSVVIVDDEKSYVELMAQMLADNLDCPVHAFIRPNDALDSLDRVSAGVIVTDYFMPEMDGVDFIKKAAKIAPEAVFIMISGHDLDSIKHELVRLKKLKARLQKPFGWLPLAEAVLRVWSGRDAPHFRTHDAGFQ
jgi:DNA-binding NtrC family response regulator